MSLKPELRYHYCDTPVIASERSTKSLALIRVVRAIFTICLRATPITVKRSCLWTIWIIERQSGVVNRKISQHRCTYLKYHAKANLVSSSSYLIKINLHLRFNYFFQNQQRFEFRYPIPASLSVCALFCYCYVNNSLKYFFIFYSSSSI